MVKSSIPVISGALSGFLVPSLIGDPFVSDCIIDSVASLGNTPPYDVVGEVLSPWICKRSSIRLQRAHTSHRKLTS